MNSVVDDKELWSMGQAITLCVWFYDPPLSLSLNTFSSLPHPNLCSSLPTSLYLSSLFLNIILSLVPPASLFSSLHPPSLIPTFILPPTNFHTPSLIPTLLFSPSPHPFLNHPSFIPSSSFLIPTLIQSSFFPHAFPHPFILLPSSLPSSIYPPSLSSIPLSSFPHPLTHPFTFFPSYLPSSLNSYSLMPTYIHSSSSEHPYPHLSLLLPSSLPTSINPPFIPFLIHAYLVLVHTSCRATLGWDYTWDRTSTPSLPLSSLQCILPDPFMSIHCSSKSN